jgi:hypothetical protein
MCEGWLYHMSSRIWLWFAFRTKECYLNSPSLTEFECNPVPALSGSWGHWRHHRSAHLLTDCPGVCQAQTRCCAQTVRSSAHRQQCRLNLPWSTSGLRWKCLTVASYDLWITHILLHSLWRWYYHHDLCWLLSLAVSFASLLPVLYLAVGCGTYSIGSLDALLCCWLLLTSSSGYRCVSSYLKLVVGMMTMLWNWSSLSKALYSLVYCLWWQHMYITCRSFTRFG